MYDIFTLSDFEQVETRSGIALCSKTENKKRYYYKSKPLKLGASKITLLLFNPGSFDGTDRTIEYIEEVCPYLGYAVFDIVNLIPKVCGNISKMTDADFMFDPINYKVIEYVINNSLAPIWLGWGRLVKGYAGELLPIHFRKLLQVYDKRVVQIDKGIPNGWYPLHPTYASGVHGKGRIKPQDLKLVSFDTRILDNYR